MKYLFLLFFVATLISCNEDHITQSKPNIVLILADDLGYSDLGCYGSEIQTPNIDSLAYHGLRFNTFHNASRCCPTRASLLTGLYPHQSGMGGMVRHTDKPERLSGAYQGYLGNNTVTLAEVLKSAGYSTYMSGKWHVGEEKKNWPEKRGFDKFYGLISGAANYFDIAKTARPNIERHFAKDGKEFLPDTTNFYLTNAITDYAVQTLSNHKSDDPFFLFLSYTAPHWPLQALEKDIKKYEGVYDSGWDEIRKKRYERINNLGILNNVSLSPRDSAVPPWENIDKKELLTRKMEVYAAMVDCMDQGVGKVLSALRETGKDENTIIIFLSDNGACAESTEYGIDWWDNGVMPGGHTSYQSYGRGWSNVSNTPFSLHKQWTHEGGISTPLIINWPNKIKKERAITNAPGHVMDIMATLVDIAGGTYPKTFKGNVITPLEGKSLLPIIENINEKVHDYLFWEHFGNMAVTNHKYKLVCQRKEGDGSWFLYDIVNDRAEQNNIIDEKPEVANLLLGKYKVWAKKVGVSGDISNKFSDEK